MALWAREEDENRAYPIISCTIRLFSEEVYQMGSGFPSGRWSQDRDGFESRGDMIFTGWTAWCSFLLLVSAIRLKFTLSVCYTTIVSYKWVLLLCDFGYLFECRQQQSLPKNENLFGVHNALKNICGKGRYYFILCHRPEERLKGRRAREQWRWWRKRQL